MKQFLLFSTFFLLSSLIIAQDWEFVAPLPGGTSDARHHPVTFSIDGIGYLLTGTVGTTPSNDFMRYDPVSDTWEALPDFPGAARSFSYGTSRGTKAYVGFGGITGQAFNDLWEYDSETETWTELSSCPCDGRYHPTFIQLDGKIFMGQGNNDTNLDDWWEYDIATDSWSQKDDLPGPPRHHPFYFGVNGKAYTGLGHGNSINGVLQIYTDWYEYDPATEQWTQLNDFPGEARVAGTQFDFEGKGYILSGDGDDHSFMEEGEFWEYDTSSDSWTQLPSHPGNSSRWAPGSFVIDEYVYFTCGESIDQLEHDMMRFPLNQIVSVENAQNEQDIKFYPNPANSVITIQNNLQDFTDIRLVSSYGQIVDNVVSNQLNVADLPNGLYFLQFSKGETVSTQKVVISH
ncbi:kelch repeat-containing protein [Sanyastnella coralliicola]|uniref:kelch repeat-containing protein n=1 Tax=Sanyastnella coralliicola TaxID=3069118 RepID=UPI0027B9C360|nr:kelch repeat-containing protein [Longitalea sp. SCSIO 12813]